MKIKKYITTEPKYCYFNSSHAKSKKIKNNHNNIIMIIIMAVMIMIGVELDGVKKLD